MKRVFFANIVLSLLTVGLSASELPTPANEPAHPSGPATDWGDDMELGLAKAKSLGKPLLVFFSALDWCEPCRKLKEEVFARPGFHTWAKDRIVLVTIDFPIDRPVLPKSADPHDERWRKAFHVSGFPTVVLADDSGRPFAVTGYRKGGVANYLRHLSQLLQIRLIRDASLKLAQETTGRAKAKHLETALSNLDERLVAQHYRPELELVMNLGDEQQQVRIGSLIQRSTSNAQVIGTPTNWSEDPLGSIGADMRRSAHFLREGKIEPLVLDYHPRIERRLARLAKRMEDSDSANGGGKASKKANNPASESRRRKRQADTGPLLDPTAEGADWAKLTPKQREKIMQSRNESFPSEFHDILSEYFRRLAKEEDASANE